MNAKRIFQLLIVFFFVACVKEDYQIPEELIVGPPIVNTAEVTNVATTTVNCGGEVVKAKGSEVTACGVCWSTSPNPTINDNKTIDGSGIGSFKSDITGLMDGSTYYVRAYAINGKGVGYGEEKSFITIATTIPTVTTSNVTNITSTGAMCGGNVTSTGNLPLLAKGVCWSTSHNPTIDDDKTNDGIIEGQYVSPISFLKENTTYYVRAYATNAKGTGYGEEKSFTTITNRNY